MNKILPYFVILFFIATFTTNCSKSDEGDSVDSQVTAIERYISSNGLQDTNLNGIYKIVLEAGNPAAIIEKGDSVWFYFAEYLFESGISTYIYTNMVDVATENYADTRFMDFSPRVTRVGSGDLLECLTTGIEDSVQGDSLLLLVPSNRAYGGKHWGAVPKNKALAFYIVIDSLKKQ